MKNEALEVLKNRRSVRKFKADQVSEELLDIVLEAGTYAPTGAGSQSPTIVAVQNPDTVAKLDAMNAAVINSPKALHPYYGAPTILLVLANPEAPTPIEDACNVGCNLVNAAYAVGLGSCWIHRSKEMFESAEGKALLKEWGLPESLRGVCSIALGYADAESAGAPPRKENYVVKIK